MLLAPPGRPRRLLAPPADPPEDLPPGTLPPGTLPPGMDASPAGPAFELPPEAVETWIAGPAGGLRVVELHPEGKMPVVFVHGLGGRLEHWAPVLHCVGPGIRALALDLPGHGGSDVPEDEDLSPPRLAAAIGALLDTLGLRHAVLVGHSLGAAVVLEYAAHHGDRALGLVLVDANGDQTRIPEGQRQSLMSAIERDPAGEVGWQFRQILHGSHPEVPEHVLAGLEAVPAEVLLATLRGSLEYGPLPALDAYVGPTACVISSMNDLPYSLHRLRPQLPCHCLGETSHWLMMDRPVEFWDLVMDIFEDWRR